MDGGRLAKWLAIGAILASASIAMLALAETAREEKSAAAPRVDGWWGVLLNFSSTTGTIVLFYRLGRAQQTLDDAVEDIKQIKATVAGVQKQADQTDGYLEGWSNR